MSKVSVTIGVGVGRRLGVLESEGATAEDDIDGLGQLLVVRG